MGPLPLTLYLHFPVACASLLLNERRIVKGLGDENASIYYMK